jgi:hypothetical protein
VWLARGCWWIKLLAATVGHPIQARGDIVRLATISFEAGAREIVAWHDEDPTRHHIDHSIDEAMNTLIARYSQ